MNKFTCDGYIYIGHFLFYFLLEKTFFVDRRIHNTVDLHNAILYNAMIHTMQKFLNINNAFYNHRNIDNYLKKKKKFRVNQYLKQLDGIIFKKK